MTCKERILSNDYADILTDYLMAESVEASMPLDYCYHAIDGGYGVVYARRNQIPPLTFATYGYLSIPKLYGLMEMPMPGSVSGPDLGSLFNSQPLSSTGSIRVQQPPLSLSGKGTIIGFIDTGIRYNLDVFKKEDGSSRILSIWDQTIQDGNPPEDFLYGTEYTRADINRALQSENPFEIVPSKDTNGHGTQMASIAAGSVLGGGLTFRGAAPQTDIAVVKLKEAKPYLRNYYLLPATAIAYQENDIMEAVKYLQRMGIAFNKPVIIVLGVGTNMGSHDGTSPLATYLNLVARRRSRAIVVCGGNEGNKEHHYEGTIPDTVEINVSDRMKGFCMELWGSIPDSYTLRIRSPGGELSPEIDFRNGLDQQVNFIFERTQITIGIFIVEQDTGEEIIFLRFDNPTQGVWSLQVYAADGQVQGSGVFHIWLPITEFLEKEVTFLRPDPEVTLTEPSNANRVITVSAYNSENDSFSFISGRGFTRNGGIKPDFCAPGVTVPGILGEITGSCAAAALTAGCVAQFMEWAVVDRNAPLVESRAIKSYFIRGANRESDISYPDQQWGYGTLDINATFESLART